MRIISSLSACSERFRLPQTCSTRTPLTTLLAHTASGMRGMAVSTATGMPTLSSSFDIVAAQRLQLPHVATSSAAPTPAPFISFAMLRPISRVTRTAVPLLAVEKKSGKMPRISPRLKLPGCWQRQRPVRILDVQVLGAKASMHRFPVLHIERCRRLDRVTGEELSAGGHLSVRVAPWDESAGA